MQMLSFDELFFAERWFLRQKKQPNVTQTVFLMRGVGLFEFLEVDS